MKKIFIFLTIMFKANLAFGYVTSDIPNACGISDKYMVEPVFSINSFMPVGQVYECNTNFSNMHPIFEINSHTCNAGYYMPANTDGCTPCPADSYCGGGTYTFSETTAQGALKCPNGYDYNTDTGKTSANQCQTHCNAGTYVDSIPIIPDGAYTQLEYLESTGTQLIGIPYKSNPDTKIYVDFALTKQVEDVFVVIGGWDPLCIGLITRGNSRMAYCLYDNGRTNDTTASYGSTDFNRHQLVLDAVTHTASVSGFAFDSTTATGKVVANLPLTAQSSLNYVYFFGSIPINQRGFVKIYSSKIWDKGILMYDLIPARRNSDNVLGMYDKVTKTFFTNSGTGTFVAGAAINGLGDSSCTTCPADSYCPGGTYGYGVSTSQGITACPDGKISDAGSDDVSDCRDPAINCSAGYYLPANASVCAMCLNDSYCVGGTYNLETNVPQGIVSCASGLFAPAGMWEVAQCGRILHVGDGFVYLRATKKTSPSLHLDLDHDGVADYFGNMTTLDVPMSRDTQRKLKVRYNNTTYSIYDDSVELNQYQN